MRLACDTSFLFAVYGNDVFSERASGYLNRVQRAVWISAFNEFELSNALRLTAFRGLSTTEQAAARWAEFENDIVAGRLVRVAESVGAMLSVAQHLSAKHTLGGGHRAFDILHVAAATVAKADTFLSFDESQLRLARAVGLAIPRL